jgi:hypothetical protein
MRQELRLNKLLGITKSGELIMVDYLFNDTLHGEPFHGATGSSFVGVTQDEIDDRNDLENVKDTYGYLWQEAVKDGATTDSMEDFLQSWIDNAEGYYIGHDTSGIHHIPDTIKKMHFDGCETFECVGGGRMFPLKEEMMIIFDQDLFDAVNAIENESLPLEMLRDLVGGELIERGIK